MCLISLKKLKINKKYHLLNSIHILLLDRQKVKTEVRAASLGEHITLNNTKPPRQICFWGLRRLSCTPGNKTFARTK